MIGNTRRSQKLIAGSLFGFSLFYFLGSFRLKMGTLASPGPGLVPMAVGILMVVFTAVYLLRVFRGNIPEREIKQTPPAEPKNYRAIVGVLLCTAVYPFLLEPLKFIVSTLIACFLMLVLLRPGRILFSLLLSLGMAVGAFLLFSRLFGVGLPSGPLETLLFRIGG